MSRAEKLIQEANTAIEYFLIVQIDSTLPCVCSEADHRWRQNEKQPVIWHTWFRACRRSTSSHWLRTLQDLDNYGFCCKIIVILLGCSESVAQFLHKALRLTIFLNKGQQIPVLWKSRLSLQILVDLTSHTFSLSWPTMPRKVSGQKAVVASWYLMIFLNGSSSIPQSGSDNRLITSGRMLYIALP